MRIAYRTAGRLADLALADLTDSLIDEISPTRMWCTSRRWHHGTVMEAPTGPGGRLTALGNQLIEVHIRLREELARLRDEVDSDLDGWPPRLPELPEHCLAFCAAVSRHHTREDYRAFPILAEELPELRPVIDELERDHRVVAGILRALEELLAGLGAGADPASAQQVRGELDGLAAVLESHFGYEERKLVAALNSLAARTGTAEDLFG